MRINGRNRLACVLLIGDVGRRITVEPLRGLPVVKDLVVDMEPFFEQYRAVQPWLVNTSEPGSRERHQSPEQRARYDDTSKCILCAACTTSCPVYWGNDTFVGPAAIVNAHRFIFDSRDEAGEERLQILDRRSGVWRCRTAFNCTDACPRGIKVTQALEEVKRAIVKGPAEREIQGPSGPAEREIQGPSGPAEREIQGPSGPAEREIQGPSD